MKVTLEEYHDWYYSVFGDRHPEDPRAWFQEKEEDDLNK